MKTKKEIKAKLANQGLKQCPRCPESKPLSEFGKSKNTKDGLNSICKEHTKEYQDINKEEISKYQKEHYKENKEFFLKKAKIYRDKNKEKLAKWQKEYRNNNKEKTLKQVKKYRDKPENKVKRNKQQKERYHTDINFKIRTNLANRTRIALNGNTKSLPTMFLIGCSIDYLMYHIQEQFTEGMSWDNCGLDGWEIDHKLPCTSFDLSDPKQQLICFNYTNLQPLWAVDNRIKSDKILTQE